MPACLHDAHNHLQDELLSEPLPRIASSWPDVASPAGRMVVNGTHPSDWPRVAHLAASHRFVLPAYGLHPWDVGAPRPCDWLDTLQTRLLADPLATVGEIGLDRWIIDHASPDDPRLAGVRRAPMQEQISTFLPQLALAATLDRPATIHCLRAYDDLLPLLRAHPLPKRGFLLHAYSGPPALVPELAALGAYFSFNPNFLPRASTPATCNQIGSPASEPPSAKLLTFAQLIPADRLLCETDAPAMIPPQAWRTHKLPPSPDGTPVNHPGNIEAAYAGLAALRGIETPDLAARIAQNFTRLFGV